MNKQTIYKDILYEKISVKDLEYKFKNNPKILSNLEWVQKHFINKKQCSHCNIEVAYEDCNFVTGYWYPTFHITHKECSKDYRENQEIECQKIDADCNDCIFFNRGFVISKGSWYGTCKKFDKEVVAHSKTCSNHECFVHRKS